MKSKTNTSPGEVGFHGLGEGREAKGSPAGGSEGPERGPDPCVSLCFLSDYGANDQSTQCHFLGRGCSKTQREGWAFGSFQEWGAAK